MSNDRRTAPWYQRTRRWGQTNITELDPLRCDLAWWREHWRRTRVQGVIVNAGGIVAYYPSRFPFHYRAEHLGDRDLFGEVTQAAREEGLVVLARMDSNRLHQDAYRQYPEWFARRRDGQALTVGDRFVTCVNSAYYQEVLPEILREIVERYRPEGFTDNSWSGLGRGEICYCESCRRKFRDACGGELPRGADWDDPAYRQWIRWSYQCRLDNWDLNNRVTRDAGGDDCLWMGMLSGDPVSQSRAFRDLAEIGRRSQIIMCDHQGRGPATGFEQNGLNGKLLHGILGWDKLVPESMAMYVRGIGPYRVASAPAAEARTWMIAGFAGGISPWWHHIGAWHEDRRQYHTAEPVMRWHQAHEQYLYDREPVATVGLLWSRENIDFYGRDEAEMRVAEPFRGFTSALTRARIPYLPIHADQLDRCADSLSVLVLPNLGGMSDQQCASVRRFVASGGGLIASGESSLYDQSGDRRDDFALADVLSVRSLGSFHGTTDGKAANWESYPRHSYLRLAPSRFAWPGSPVKSDTCSARHEVLAEYDQTDIIPFGGRLECVEPHGSAAVPLTYVPPFPIYPPEFSWMRTPQTSLPALILNESARQGRVAYLAADIDRCFAREEIPDHGRLLANLVRWTARGNIPLLVEGPGYLDCHLYRQPGRLILHLLNLTCSRAWPSPPEEGVAVGPLTVRLQLPQAFELVHASLLVAGGRLTPTTDGQWVTVEIKSILDHEVLVIADADRR